MTRSDWFIALGLWLGAFAVGMVLIMLVFSDNHVTIQEYGIVNWCGVYIWRR